VILKVDKSLPNNVRISCQKGRILAQLCPLSDIIAGNWLKILLVAYLIRLFKVKTNK